MIHSAKIFVSILLLSLTSCATNQTQKTADEAALKNWQQITEDEKAYYVKKTGAAEPQWGLALSGGGQRSASTSVGFLEGLHKADILSKLDVISTVSGGSYAAYWWFTKQHIGREVENDLFNNSDSQNLIFRRNYSCGLCEDVDPTDNLITGKCYYKNAINDCEEGKSNKIARYDENRFYFNNSNRSNLLTFAQQHNKLKYAELVLKATSIVTAPAHWLANGLFDMRLNLNVFQNYYQNGLQRNYEFYPLALAHEKCSSEKAEDDILRCYENTNGRFRLNKEVKPTELFNTIQENNLPFWVINTTAAYSHSSVPKMTRAMFDKAYSERFFDTVYEFSPTHQGSPRFGFHKVDPESPNFVSLSRQVAISGAAVDSLGPIANLAIDAANVSLGQYINNPANDDATARFFHRLIPFPFYWLHNYQHDETGLFTYLSDGGHSDNLGLYSLIRRGVKNIIVLDNEHEPGVEKRTIATFEALQTAADKLDEEQKLSICFDGKKLGTKYNQAQKALKINFKNATSSVFTLHVTKSCNCDLPPEQDKQKVSTIYYTKLSIDYESTEIKPKELVSVCAKQGGLPMDETPIANQKHRYSCPTRYYAIQDGAINRDFPHDATHDIFYSASQFAAYTALGYDLGRELVRKMQPKDLNYFEAKE